MAVRQSIGRLTCCVVVTLIAHAACEHTAPSDAAAAAGTITLVNRVRAAVRVESCPTCAAKLEAALARRLDPAEINVTLERETVSLTFQRSSPFASASFRDTVKESGGEVQRVDIEACGTVENAGGRSWITTGSARLLLEGTVPAVTGVDVCVTGELRDLIAPPKLVVGTF